jgi:hypothetical protein
VQRARILSNSLYEISINLIPKPGKDASKNKRMFLS